MISEVILFVLAAIIGFYPSIVDIKLDDKALGWWSSLTKGGKIYTVLIFIFMTFGIIVIVRNNLETKEEKESANIKHSKERKLDSLRFIKVVDTLNNVRLAIGKLNTAIEKGGYKYDSEGGIITQKNIQNVESGGRAIQNNAENNGNQYLGDVEYNFNLDRFSESELKELKYQFNLMKKKYPDQRIVRLIKYEGTNAGYRIFQIKQIIQVDGFLVYETILHDLSGDAPPVGYKFKDDHSGEKGIFIEIGYFKPEKNP